MPLTSDDLNAIRQLFDIVLDQQLEAKLDAKLSRFPSKEEFFASIDQIIKELQAIRDEQVTSAHLVSAHEDRITALESVHPEGQHITAKP